MTMTMDPLVYFRRLIANRELLHAYAFVGTNYHDKVTVTNEIGYLLARQALMENNDASGKVLRERVQAHSYPDILWLEPDGRYIRVDQIRELRQWLATTPVEGDFKLAIIDQADQLNLAAANALLTILEEPPEQTYLILYVKEMADLLDTLQSRVQATVFTGVDIESRIEQLVARGLNRGIAAQLAELPIEAVDQVIEARESAEMAEWLEQLVHYYQLLIQGADMAFVVVQTHLNKYMQPTHLAGLGLDYLLRLNYYALALSTGSQREAGYDLIRDKIDQVSPSPQRLLALNEAILSAKQLMTANVSATLAYESLAIKMIRYQE